LSASVLHDIYNICIIVTASPGNNFLCLSYLVLVSLLCAALHLRVLALETLIAIYDGLTRCSLSLLSAVSNRNRKHDRGGESQMNQPIRKGRAKSRKEGWGSKSVREASSSFRIPCGWNPAFAERRNLVLETENKPHIDTRAELLKLESAETASDLEGKSFVRVFMQGPRDSDICLPRADRVEAICLGANVRLLLEEKGRGNQERVALLDERSFEGERQRSRTPKGPLTARDLYLALKQPVRRGFIIREEVNA
jgi:hypothetical protein